MAITTECTIPDCDFDRVVLAAEIWRGKCYGYSWLGLTAFVMEVVIGLFQASIRQKLAERSRWEWLFKLREVKLSAIIPMQCSTIGQVGQDFKLPCDDWVVRR